ncbi:tumor necrosis factor receptor superfamily member 5 isoform X2 [Trachinotus anak]|uniref:tumor necrosis factor receptor superfamily member 5 isoform X2 n=1 Tax=Trachinotus anak TaxID=443729 RepID=UPI0039F2042E
MLRFTAQVTKMRRWLLMMMMMKCAFMGRTGAQLHCDPLTQYAMDGQCCKMCGPGTRMLSGRSCEEPQCSECEKNQYQDEYTTNDKCKLQPYCDPHKNFQPVVTHSKKTHTTCMCLLGFHCSADACITCVPHTSCEPGYGAQSIGNHTHDTVCHKCPEGSFSNEDSWSDPCKTWTECKDGYRTQQLGTDTSDNICAVEGSRQHIVVAVVVAVIAAAFLAGALICFGCKEDARRKDCVELCQGETWEVPRVPMTPEDDTVKEPMFPEQQFSQEEGGTRTPEENDDELCRDMSIDPNRTENGNYVGQESGKTEKVSRQESQTHLQTENSLNCSF